MQLIVSCKHTSHFGCCSSSVMWLVIGPVAGQPSGSPSSRHPGLSPLQSPETLWQPRAAPREEEQKTGKDVEDFCNLFSKWLLHSDLVVTWCSRSYVLHSALSQMTLSVLGGTWLTFQVFILLQCYFICSFVLCLPSNFVFPAPTPVKRHPLNCSTQPVTQPPAPLLLSHCTSTSEPLPLHYPSAPL